MTHFIICLIETYDVASNSISISGISSGAAMATQMHVIHSATIMGAGIIAGGMAISFFTHFLFIIKKAVNYVNNIYMYTVAFKGQIRMT